MSERVPDRGPLASADDLRPPAEEETKQTARTANKPKKAKKAKKADGDATASAEGETGTATDGTVELSAEEGGEVVGALEEGVMPLPEGKNAEGQAYSPPLDDAAGAKKATPKKRAPRKKKEAAKPKGEEEDAEADGAEGDVEATPKKKRTPAKRKAKADEPGDGSSEPKDKKARTSKKQATEAKVGAGGEGV